MQILDKEKLLNDGYLSFNLKDFDFELYTNLYNSIDKLKLIEKINQLRFDTSLNLTDDCSESDIHNLFNELKINESTHIDFNYATEDGFISTRMRIVGNFSELNNFEQKIKTFNQNPSQVWYYGNGENISNKVSDVLSVLYKEIVGNLYKDDIKSKNEYTISDYKIVRGTDLSLYIKDSFIGIHNDGYDVGRLCVLLLYLNDDYQEGFGGELVLGDDNKKIPPTFGNVVILDFTKNNITHSVNSVLDPDFKRFAFIKFFHE